MQTRTHKQTYIKHEKYTKRKKKSKIESKSRKGIQKIHMIKAEYVSILTNTNVYGMASTKKAFIDGNRFVEQFTVILRL